MPKTTIREVAQVAGVSIATVSDILRATEKSACYNGDTAARVRAAAEDLGYEANGAARLLRLKKTNLVGLAINVEATHLTPLVQAAHKALKEKGYEPIFMEVGPGYSTSPFFNMQMLAGIISADTKMMSEVPEFYEKLHHKLPVIALYPMPSKSIDCVTTNRIRLIEMAVEHLVALGHRQIAFAEYGPCLFPTDALKVEGWKRALAKFPIDPHPRYRISYDYGTAKVPAICDALVSMTPPPTALICEINCALYVIKHLQTKGWKIPQQFSVVGHGRSDYADLSSPSLTTVLPPLEQVGRIAAERLVQRIVAGGAEKYLPPLQQLVEPTLVIRESTASLTGENINV